MLTMVVSPLRKVAGLIGSLAATALLLALIHPSAWKVNSAKFVFLEFSEVQPHTEGSYF
jgi:hypothetical protein